MSRLPDKITARLMCRHYDAKPIRANLAALTGVLAPVARYVAFYLQRPGRYKAINYAEYNKVSKASPMQGILEVLAQESEVYFRHGEEWRRHTINALPVILQRGGSSCIFEVVEVLAASGLDFAKLGEISDRRLVLLNEIPDGAKANGRKRAATMAKLRKLRSWPFQVTALAIGSTAL